MAVSQPVIRAGAAPVTRASSVAGSTGSPGSGGCGSPLCCSGARTVPPEPPVPSQSSSRTASVRATCVVTRPALSSHQATAAG